MPRGATVSEEGSRLVAGNGRVGVEFVVDDGGCGLRSLVHRSRGAAFGFGGDADTGTSFWEVEFRNGAGHECRVDSLDAGTFTHGVEERDDGTDLVLEWTEVPVTFPDRGRQGEASVVIDVHVPDAGGLTYWEPTIEVSAEAVTVWGMDFPTVDDLHRAGADRSADNLLLPDGFGAHVPDPTAREDLTAWEQDTYPAGSWTMQLLGFDNGDAGVYLGLHDPAGRPKTMAVESDPRARELAIRIGHRPEGMGRAQSQVSLGYSVALGVYDGDWYDAAEHYREWALEEAAWTQRGPIASRAGVPEWITETSLWWTPSTVGSDAERGYDPEDAAATAELLRELHDRFPVTTAAHWYNWHEVPFDTDYPDYFPPRPGVADTVAGLQADGIHVMPYINARLADASGRIWTEADLASAAAKRAPARYDPGGLVRHVEEYGNGQLLSPICPTTTTWRETVTGIVERLAGEVGVDAVYLDQIAATSPARCFDPDHDHPPGGGAYGVAAYQELLADLVEWKAENDSDLALTTECNAEPFMGWIDAYLTWHTARADLVPLFPAVYGDYTLTFGRSFFESDLDDPSVFAAKVGQLFSYGTQLGWITAGGFEEDRSVAERLLDADHDDVADYLLETARVLEAAAAYVTMGRRLRDPAARAPVPAVEMDWDMGHHGYWEVEVPVVMAAAWASPVRNGVAVTATNWDEDTHAGVWALDRDRLPEDARIEVLAGTGELSHRIESDDRLLELVVPPRSTLAIEITPE